MHMSILNSLFPVTAITRDMPGSADAWITESEGVRFGVCQVAWKCI